MYYQNKNLGFGVKIKHSVPPEISKAAKELPKLTQEFGNFTGVLSNIGVYAPYVIIGIAGLVAFVVLSRKK